MASSNALAQLSTIPTTMSFVPSSMLLVITTYLYTEKQDFLSYGVFLKFLARVWPYSVFSAL
jgi:hypothetical protein